jgi:ATP-dependent helicase/nuclease subunit B
MIRDRFDHDHTWSVTKFETFRNCPYLFFIKYILGIQEMEDLEPGIPPEKKGLIFHEVVERFYNEFGEEGSKRVTRDELSEAVKLIRSIALEVIETHPNKGPYWDALKDQFIGTQDEKGLLECFLEIEADYEGPFRVRRTEQRFGMGEGSSPPARISLPGNEDGPDSFKLRGSVDRLDTISTRDGDMDFIWDYKTGSRDVDKESVQVPLYLAAMRKLFPDNYPAGGGYYYVRKRGSISRAPVHGEDLWTGKVKDREALQSHITSLGNDIQDTVQRCLEMIDAIRSGELGPQAKCKDRYCKFLHLCRRGDA